MRFFVFVTVTAVALLLPGEVLAHGTSEPGPNGGEVRMPGAFHVEAVVVEERLRFYLLDMQFENPQVADSSVTARIEQGGSTTELQCTPAPEVNAFRCPLPPGVSLERGILFVDASRAGLPADPARYELPLEWSGGQGGDG